jgi:hypothetical protein
MEAPLQHRLMAFLSIKSETAKTQMIHMQHAYFYKRNRMGTGFRRLAFAGANEVFEFVCGVSSLEPTISPW